MWGQLPRTLTVHLSPEKNRLRFKWVQSMNHATAQMNRKLAHQTAFQFAFDRGSPIENPLSRSNPTAAPLTGRRCAWVEKRYRWKQWDSCALVGRSPVIKIEENGPYIDKHEAVWRFNLAATQGFSNFVGKRTHLRLVNNGDSSRAMNGLAGKSEHSIFTVRSSWRASVLCRVVSVCPLSAVPAPNRAKLATQPRFSPCVFLELPTAFLVGVLVFLHVLRVHG